MKKRLFALWLVCLMLCSLLPAAALAEGERSLAYESIYAASESRTVTVSGEKADNDQLFAGFVDREMGKKGGQGGGAKGVAKGSAGDSLPAPLYNFYTAIVPEIHKIAIGQRASTVFEYDLTELGEGELLSLPVKKFDDALQKQLNLLFNALEDDLPYDMYWHDKITGYFHDCSHRTSADGSRYEITTLQFSLAVDKDYRANDDRFTVNTAIGQRVETAADNARAIVAQNAVKSDYEKLRAYNKAICEAVTYDHDAVKKDHHGRYVVDHGDPWQLIWVFDGDPDTKAVCEGYSKAFQHLCDLTDFKSKTVQSIIVSGHAGGGHMWNIVRMEDGKRYLVDVTQSDAWMEYDGRYEKYFLIGADGGVFPSYQFYGQTRTFSSYSQAIYGEAKLTLSDQNYAPDGATITITAQPQSVWTQAGTEVTFTVEAAGSNLTYQWYTKAAGAVDWTLLDGETAKTLTLVASAENGGSQYYCLLQNGKGELATDVVTLNLGSGEGRFLEINETNFPDAAFRQWVMGNLAGGKDYMTREEVEQVITIEIYPATGITTLQGIEHFTKLEELGCDISQSKLTSLDVSKNTELKELWCNSTNKRDSNKLTSLDVSKNTKLEVLWCRFNRLTSLDLSKSTELTVLMCDGNQLTSLDLSKNTSLTSLDCSSNQLASLDLSKNRNLMLDDGVNVDPQQLPIQGLVPTGDKYTCDLSALLIDPAKVLMSDDYGLLNAEYCTYHGSGVFTFTKSVTSFEYMYRTGAGLLPMLVNVPLELREAPEPPNAPTITTQPDDKTVTSGSEAKFIVQVKEKDVSYQWYSKAPDGADWFVMEGMTSNTLTRTASVNNNGYQYRCLVKNKDDGWIWSNAARLTVILQPPVITTQPRNQTVKRGMQAKFSVKATGEKAIYVWYERENPESEWKALAGEEEDTLQIVAFRAIDGHQFYCHVSNPEGYVNSAVATLTVEPDLPVIKTQPKDATVKSGAEVNFKVKASGSGLIYQWYTRPDEDADWIEMEGENKDTLKVVASMAKNGRQYYCLVRNGDGSEESDAVTLTTTPVPLAIKTQPRDTTVKSGSKAKLSVKASGPSLQYQWYIKENGSAVWREIGGETKADCTFIASMAKDGAQFYCKVWNEDESMTSAIATLTVTPVPTIIKTQPRDAVAKSGSKAKFKVSASGADLHYRWFCREAGDDSWLPIDGAVKAEYGFTVNMSMNGRQYRCSVYNQDGELYTEAATLTVTPQPPAIKTQPKDTTVKSGSKAKFKVSASGPNLKYQWYERAGEDADWTEIQGAVKAELSFAAPLAKNGYQYRCRVWNDDETLTSCIATLTVTPQLPVIKTQPKDVMVKPGDKAEFKVKVSGKNVFYQWYRCDAADGLWVEIEGANKASYQIIAQESDFGCQFRCIASNADGWVWSNPATLLQR